MSFKKEDLDQEVEAPEELSRAIGRLLQKYKRKVKGWEDAQRWEDAIEEAQLTQTCAALGGALLVLRAMTFCDNRAPRVEMREELLPYINKVFAHALKR